MFSLLFKELKNVVQNVPEIIEVVGSACADQVLNIDKKDGDEKLKEVLQSLFTELMTAGKDVISEAVSKIGNRLNIQREVFGNLSFTLCLWYLS